MAKMAKQIAVTRVQREAARIIVERSEAKGKAIPSEIRKIAEAQTRPADEAVSPPSGASRPR